MKFKFLMLVLIFSLGQFACGKKINTRRYYVLEWSGRSQQVRPDTSLFHVKVDVRDFRVARAFDQTRMALRTNSNELDYYFYHHWAVKPSLAVADFVYDVIEERNMFSGATRGISYDPDYIIQGDIKSLERLQEEKKAFTHVHMTIELIDARTEMTVLHYEEDRRLAIEPAKSMNTYAEVTSQMLLHFTEQFLDQVQAYLEAARMGEGR